MKCAVCESKLCETCDKLHCDLCLKIVCVLDIKTHRCGSHICRNCKRIAAANSFVTIHVGTTLSKKFRARKPNLHVHNKSMLRGSKIGLY